MTEIIIEEAKLIESLEKGDFKVEWSGNNGFGELTFKYNKKGGYELDSEYLSVPTIIKILQKVKI